MVYIHLRQTKMIKPWFETYKRYFRVYGEEKSEKDILKCIKENFYENYFLRFFYLFKGCLMKDKF